MIAKVNLSNRLVDSLAYGANEHKGGEVLLQNGYITFLSPEENAKRWERMSNDYRNKAVHIILSFSDKDTERLRAMTKEQRRKMEQDMLKEFLNVMTDKGNNVKGCPFVCFHHGNTDNEHLHLYILMTTWQGKRLATDFIGKNADRAAARVSILWNMEGPLKAMQYEWKHMLKTKKITEDRMPNQLREYYSRPRPKRQHEFSDDQNVINDRLRRKQAAEEAQKRKKKCAFIITEAAKASKNRQEFKEKLEEQGLNLYQDSIAGYSIAFHENDKLMTYSFKRLGLDQDIVPKDEVDKPFVKHEQVKDEKQTVAGRRHDQASPVKSAAQDERSRGSASRPPLKPHAPSGGSSSGDNREFEVGEKEGYEQSIKNESRMKM